MTFLPKKDEKLDWHALISGYGGLLVSVVSLVIALSALNAVTEVKGMNTLQSTAQNQISELKSVVTQQKEMISNLIHVDSQLVALNNNSNKTTDALSKQLTELAQLLKIQEKQNLTMQGIFTVQNKEHLAGVNFREQKHYADSVKLQMAFDTIVDFENRVFEVFHHAYAFGMYNLLDQTWNDGDMRRHLSKMQSMLNGQLENSYLYTGNNFYRSWRGLHDWISQYFSQQKNYWVSRNISVFTPAQKEIFQKEFVEKYLKFINASEKMVSDSRIRSIF